jgi:hypothetical protein
MTPTRVMAEPCADPKNLTNQLDTILRESFGKEPKGWGASIKNPTLINTTNSLTLGVIEFLSSQCLVGRMVKRHKSMSANLFFNVVRIVLMML